MTGLTSRAKTARVKAGAGPIAFGLTVLAILALVRSPARAADNPPRRILSLDFCADQYVLGLAGRAQIAALSPDATKDFSYFRLRAKGLKRQRPELELILAARPDLVVRAYGGGPSLKPALGRLGIPLVELSYAEDFTAIKADIARLGARFGQSGRADRVIASMDRTMAQLRASVPATARPKALYVSSGGAVAGPGALPHEILAAAGFDDARSAQGWGRLDLERLVADPPLAFALGFFDLRAHRGERWSAARGPVFDRLVSSRPHADIAGATLACPAWFALDAAIRVQVMRTERVR